VNKKHLPHLRSKSRGDYPKDETVSEVTKGFATSGRDYLKILIGDMKLSNRGNKELIS
jgi:hypothetical protein